MPMNILEISAMADLQKIVSFTNEFLGIDSIKDYCPNGLQVEGKREVGHIVTGVSACMELFNLAADIGAEAVLVHHGMFWDSDPRPVKGSVKARLKFLLDNDMSLIGYHLPLDRHPEVGNNIRMVKSLDLSSPKPFGMYGGQPIGFMGNTRKAEPIGGFVKRIEEVTNRKSTHHDFGPAVINVVAVCTGSAPGLVREAIDVGADMFITGEQTEWVYHLCKEEKIHYVAAGHHATERFGVEYHSGH